MAKVAGGQATDLALLGVEIHGTWRPVEFGHFLLAFDTAYEAASLLVYLADYRSSSPRDLIDEVRRHSEGLHGSAAAPLTDVPHAGEVLDEAVLAARELTGVDRSRALAEVAIALKGRSDAPELLEEALRVARELTGVDRNRALAEVAITLARAGRVAEAHGIGREVADEAERAQALAEVSIRLTQAGHVEQALKIARDEVATTWGSRDRALTEAAKWLARDGRVDQAWEVAREARGWMGSQALAEVAIALARADRVDEALQVAHEITGQVERAGALAEVAVGLGNDRAATKILQEALKIAREVEKGSWLQQIERRRASNQALAAIAIVLGRAGRIDEARSVLSEISSHRGGPSGPAPSDLPAQISNEALYGEEERASSLAEVATTLAQAGRIEEALRIISHISNEWQQSTPLAETALALAEAGRLDEALTALSQITRATELSRALLEVSMAMTQADRVDEALKVAHMVPGEMEQAQALAEAAIALVRASRLEEALQVAHEVPDGVHRARALAEVARASGIEGVGIESHVGSWPIHVARLYRLIARDVRRLIPDLQLSSIRYSSPGVIELLGALNPLKVICDFASSYRKENTARQRQEMAFQLELLDRMTPELRDEFAPGLLKMITDVGNHISHKERVGKITIIEIDR